MNDKEEHPSFLDTLDDDELRELFGLFEGVPYEYIEDDCYIDPMTVSSTSEKDVTINYITE